MNALTTQERLEMMNLIMVHTAPVRNARAKLQKRYGKRVAVMSPCGNLVETEELIVPKEISQVDQELSRLETQITEVIMDEYGQIDRTPDPEMEVAI